MLPLGTNCEELAFAGRQWTCRKTDYGMNESACVHMLRVGVILQNDSMLRNRMYVSSCL